MLKIENQISIFMCVKLFKDCLYIGRYKNLLQVNFVGPLGLELVGFLQFSLRKRNLKSSWPFEFDLMSSVCLLKKKN